MVSEAKILQDEFLVSELRRRRSSFLAILKRNFFIGTFVIFVLLYRAMVLADPQDRYAVFRNTMQRTFDTDAELPLNQVKSIPLLWSYFNHTLFPAIMAAQVNSDSSLTLERIFTHSTIRNTKLDLFGTQLIGPQIVVRTFRVRKNSGCTVDGTFNRGNRVYHCFPAYSELTKDESPYGRGRRVFQYGKPEFFESLNISSVGVGFPVVTGQVGTYSGNGFLLTFGAETVDQSVAKLDYAIDKMYVDLSTRAVMIEFNAWNPNEGFIGVVRILFERSTSGQWVNTFSLDVLSERYVNITFDTIMVVELLVCLLVCIYIGEEISELCIQKTKYVKDGWNLVDWINLIMLLIFMGVRGQLYINGSGVLDDLGNNKYTDLSYFAHYATICRNINSINTIFMALKCIKYVTFIPFVDTLMLTIRFSWKYFVSFIFLYLTVFFGFSLAYNIGFGERFPELSSFQLANMFLARSYAGDVDLTAVYESSPSLGGILIVMFIAVMYLLCMNVFYGIMIVALSEAKIRQAVSETDTALQRMWAFFLKALSEFDKFLFEECDFNRYLPSMFAHRRALKQVQENLVCEKEGAIRLDINDGGPMSMHCGRLPKKSKLSRGPKLATVSDSSSDSEVDLGPLSKSAVNKRKREELRGEIPPLSDTEIYFNAIKHMSNGLQQRGEAMQKSVVCEMKDLMQVCAGIHVALEVMVRRSNDLHMQQQEFLTGI